MERWQIIPLGMVAMCGLGGVMAVTNPDRAAYEAYAVDRLSDLAEDRCQTAPAEFGIILQGPCRAAITAAKPNMLTLIAAATTRQNLVLFSIYRSDLSIPEIGLNVKVESIGLFNNFVTYKTP